MGLIRATLKSANSTLADQWVEYFYCDALSNNILIKKGQHQVTSKGNSKASDNIITNGCGIAINEGQAMLIVEDGKIVDFSVEPGRFTWSSSSEPSLFDNGWKGLKDSFKTFGKRFQQGGETGKDQRVYYVNLKEIFDNKFGSATPMPYRDPTYRGIYIRYFGQYTFKVSDPLVFYANVSGNISNEYTKEALMEQCDAEFVNALDTTLSKCSDEGYQYNDLPKKQVEIAHFMNDTLDEDWHARRGIEIESVALSKVTPDDDSRMRIAKIDDSIMLSDSRVASGRLVDAQANAMESAAKNEAGAFTGFLGMGMAANAGANQSGAMFENMEAQANNPFFEQNKAKTWTCVCGAKNEGKFCNECGKPQPLKAGAWTCTCGKTNTGKFCSDCGSAKPVTGFVCSNETCGYQSEETMKFCPNCGSANKLK
ncbi:MAG: SPFH domain-containing protein [Erysipelotrichaceae bacterium]